MGPENESRSGHHRLTLYPQTGTLEVRLQKEPDYAVRDLVELPDSFKRSSVITIIYRSFVKADRNFAETLATKPAGRVGHPRDIRVTYPCRDYPAE